jgi:hypothetical protein
VKAAIVVLADTETYEALGRGGQPPPLGERRQRQHRRAVDVVRQKQHDAGDTRTRNGDRHSHHERPVHREVGNDIEEPASSLARTTRATAPSSPSRTRLASHNASAAAHHDGEAAPAAAIPSTNPPAVS